MKRLLDIGRGALVLLLIAAGAGAERPPVDEPAVCLECHPELEETFAAPHVHTAFGDGECSGCHNPHASRHAGLLGDAERELCRRCHDEAQAPLAAAHPPAANGDCTHCHAPHASDHPAVLRTGVVENCSGCHEGSASWSVRAFVHAPVEEGDCLTCHEVHGSDVAGMLSGSVPGLCLDCHDTGPEFARAHGGRDIGDADCVACHDPHASEQAGLLRANQHAPFAGEDCEACHDALAAGGGFAIAAAPRDMCLECHGEVASYRRADHRHNLDDEASCLQCHNPHASNVGALLLRDESTLCMGCHFNDKEDKEAWVTHDAMACRECHVAHGNDDPQLLVTRGTELCGRCHETAHRVTHPVGPEIIDPRTEQSVTCLSCHRLHGARFEQYLPLSPRMELCVQCHKR